MFAQVFGAEQPLLLCSDGGKQDRAPRLLRALAEGANQLEQDATTGGVVVRAVIDIVARHVGANAQVIVVRGVEDGLVFKLQVRAGQHTDNIVRLERANLAGDARLQFDIQRNGLEIARLRVLHELGNVEARGGSQTLR